MKPENAKTYTKITYVFACITAVFVALPYLSDNELILKIYNIPVQTDWDMSQSFPV